MNTKIILSILIFANLSSYSYAQLINLPPGSAFGDVDIIVATNKMLDDTVDVSVTEGSPYENESFVFGKVISEELNISSPYLMRYNIYNDVIEVKDKDQLNELLRSFNIYVIISNKEYHYAEYYNESNTIKKGYFTLLYRGSNIELLSRKTQKYKEAVPPKNSFQPKQPAAFVDHETFYMKKEAILLAIPTKKKEFIGQFPGIEADLKKFMKANKISLNSEDDIIELFTYIDSQLK
jgi:hypothetical protein